MGLSLLETGGPGKGTWGDGGSGIGTQTWENLAELAHYRPSDLARISGVSMRTLQRHFRARFNCTVTDWLRQLRLDQARIRLGTCNSVKEVAFDLGYKQPSHFTRDFKDRFGVPPRELMRGNGQDTTS